MKTVEIFYNPYFAEAGLKINGKKYENEASRIGEFVLGKPMDVWLERKVVSYRRWDGILPEMMEYLNDDELEIIFSGTRDDFDRVKDQLTKQHGTVREKGFEPGKYTLLFHESRKPEEIKKMVQKFVDNRIRFVPMQKDMMEMEYICRELQEMKECTADGVGDIARRLSEVIDEIICGCTDEKYVESWENARREFIRIFSGL